jgi:hypothetical protein
MDLHPPLHQAIGRPRVDTGVGAQLLWVLVAGAVAAAAVALLPDLPAGNPPAGQTHYAGLIMGNQPWGNLLFMAAPFVLVYAVVLSGHAIGRARNRLLAGGADYDHTAVVADRDRVVNLRRFQHVAGILAGLYFIGLVFYLLPRAIIPLVQTSGFRGWADIVAVFAYGAAGLAGGWLYAIETGIVGGDDNAHSRTQDTILVTAHVAMIFGMLAPWVLGYGTRMAGGM